MHIVLFEDAGFVNLLPLAYWRAVFELRCGCGSLLDHVRARYPEADITLFVRPELKAVVADRTRLPVNVPPAADDVFYLNGRVLLREALSDVQAPAACWAGDAVLWADVRGPAAHQITWQTFLDPAQTGGALASLPRLVATAEHPALIAYPWDLVHHNTDMIVHAWRRLGSRGIEGKIYGGAHILEHAHVCVGRGSRIKPGAVLDAEDGPIIIGENVTIQPNATIQGPCCIGDGSIVQTGVSVRGGTSIGRVCKIGGEIEGSIIHGYSNKQHDGFLGHAYIGEFVNLAADTVNSDLKNTYGPIRVPINGVCIDSGHTFVGVTIGDHSKTGIGQLFPTGAVVGFGSSVATSGLAPKWVPSFRWLTDEANESYDVERCLAVAKIVMARRKLMLSEAEEELFRRLPEIARRYERTPGEGTPEALAEVRAD
jgi:UDP-N-acetylglucosamine diphosphorylase/glucosamine-1-phosphate N-acetyltransferase